jgi:hypothetical protein
MMSESHFHGFFGSVPPELAAQVERHQMQAEDYRHAVARFFDEISQENLFTFMSLMHTISGNTEGPGANLASYYEGITLATLHERFNACMGCGKDHDKIAEEFTPPTDNVGKPQPAPGSESPSSVTPEELNPQALKDMEEYNLDDVRDSDTLKLIGFVCKGCGMRYITIDDRMKQPPGVEGCSGCRSKAKWG